MDAQRRNCRRRGPSLRSKDACYRLRCSWLIVALCAAVALIVIALQVETDVENVAFASSAACRQRERRGGVVVRAMHFLHAYPQRFVNFYAPKLQLLRRWTTTTLDALELSKDASRAVDAAIALVAVASVHHAIEVARRAVLRRLQQQKPTAAGDAEDDHDGGESDSKGRRV